MKQTIRILLAGLAVMIFNAVFGMITCGHFFSWVYQLEPTNIWKPMDGPPGAFFMVASLVLSIILAVVYTIIKNGLPGKCVYCKGAFFGLCVWAVGMLPGMLATYAFMTVAPTVVVYWLIIGLIKTPLNGIIIATIVGDKK
ncbi:MAG: putative membrane protein [uncultured bacterium]|nr:MAG: putative membrane protein [uncultured bacterium]